MHARAFMGLDTHACMYFQLLVAHAGHAFKHVYICICKFIYVCTRVLLIYAYVHGYTRPTVISEQHATEGYGQLACGPTWWASQHAHM